MGSIPIVRPTFDTNNMPTISAIDGSASSAQFDNTIKGIVDAIPRADVTASPYMVGHDAAPNLPIRHNFQMGDDNRQPVNNSVQERKMARQQNNVAALGNTVKAFVNRHEEKKQTELTSNIATVMKAQQQVDNAKAVLAGDPNNAMAKSVLLQNMQVIDSKLSDDKLRKQISKAFDVSFTDPEANNTPEIKAMQAAHEQVKAATSADVDHNTGAEKKVGELAANGGQTPTQQVQTQTAQDSKPKSYAEQFMGKSPLSIAANPEYAAQLAVKEKQDQHITQYVIPKLLDIYEKRETEQFKQGQLDARAKYKSLIDYGQAIDKLNNESNIASARDKTMLSIEAQREKASMARTVKRVDALLEIGKNKNRAVADKANAQALQSLTGAINNIDKDNTEIAAAIAGNKGNSEQLQILNHKLEMNNLSRQQLADERQKAQTRIYGTPVVDEKDPVATSGTRGYVNGAAGTSNASNNSGSQPVAGQLLSDSSDDDEEDDDGEDEAVDKFFEGFDK